MLNSIGTLTSQGLSLRYVQSADATFVTCYNRPEIASHLVFHGDEVIPVGRALRFLLCCAQDVRKLNGDEGIIELGSRCAPCIDQGVTCLDQKMYDFNQSTINVRSKLSAPDVYLSCRNLLYKQGFEFTC
jgi:hypothetical protein